MKLDHWLNIAEAVYWVFTLLFSLNISAVLYVARYSNYW